MGQVTTQQPVTTPPPTKPSIAARVLQPVTAPIDEAARQALLDRMKRRATGLLVLATIIFVITRLLEHRYPWLGYVRATAEASMVGGLADWFAVTALFRRPLGLPIPHTAIVAVRKDQVGRSLGGFVQRNFLSREVLARKLESLTIAANLARWISQPENSKTIARHAATGLAAGARLLRDEGRVRHSRSVTRARSTSAGATPGGAST